MEMTIKNDFLEQSDAPECESSLTLTLRFCFLFLIICISASLACAETLSENIDPASLPKEPSLAPSPQDANTPKSADYSNTSFNIWENPAQIAELSDQWLKQADGNTAANVTAEIDKEPPPLVIEESPTVDASHQLWEARISASKDRKSNQSKNELRQIIKQIDSIEFKPKQQSPEPAIAVEPIQEPNEISQEQEPGKAETKPSDGRITDQTLQAFKTLSQQPDQLHNPLELAEILFNSHCLEEAAKCYQESLNRMTTNETEQPASKAWVLFQIGNCLQNTDPKTAIQLYRKSIAEYPDSPWADLAKAKSKLIDWYQQDKPRELVAENQILKIEKGVSQK